LQNQEYFDQVRAMDSEYKPENVDIDLALRSKEYLDTLFPDGIKCKVENMSEEELLELFKSIEKEAETLMDVHIDNVDFYSTEKVPECYYYGSYSHDDNTFHINLAFINSGNPELIQEQVFTIFHELKHARQWAAILGEKDYGYSEAQLIQWAENFQHYIPSVIDDELYRKQPLERDSFGFESILKGEITL
jgi:hypothetical protein